MYTKAEYDRGDAVAFSWHIDDIRSIIEQREPAVELTDDELRDILSRFDRHHEGADEQLWYDLEFHLDDYLSDKEKK